MSPSYKIDTIDCSNAQCMKNLIHAIRNYLGFSHSNLERNLLI